VTHRDPATWARPEAFEPERFAPGSSANRHRYAYFPFGGGARHCIGNQFAILEAQLIIAMMAQKYRLRRAPGHPVEAYSAGTLRPRRGMLMRLRPI
jgi:cytochrome P450